MLGKRHWFGWDNSEIKCFSSLKHTDVQRSISFLSAKGTELIVIREKTMARSDQIGNK